MLNCEICIACGLPTRDICQRVGATVFSKTASATKPAAPNKPCQPVLVPNPEVLEKPIRRRFTAEYKLLILQQVEAVSESGQIGALLRRQGFYSSNLTTWRRQRDNGTIEALSPKKRGRKARRQDPLIREIEQLRRHCR